MPCSYYIYYRVEDAKAAACASAVNDLFSALRKTTGISGRLLRKRGEPLLWMEIYERVGDEAQFEWELTEAAARLQFEQYLQSGSRRHTECFVG